MKKSFSHSKTKSSKNYLEIKEVTKSFSSFEALKGITFTVGRGDFLCLLGPSGCGKTTLLRCIAGLENHSSGSIIQDGHPVGELPVQQRDFGIVFQSYALFPNLTVWNNVFYGVQTIGEERKADTLRVEQLLEMVRLSDHRDKYPAQLSGGEQQRVALVRALATSPGLLLLDEPLSALDAQVRHHLRREIKDIQKNLGVTTIMVTHDQEEAMSMADQVAVMRDGVIEQIGSPTEIYTCPASTFVAEFIGTMNIFSGFKKGQNQIAVDGFVLRSNPKKMKNGSEVNFGFRPESIILNPEKENDENHLAASVHDIELRGAMTRIFLQSRELKGEFCADLWSGDTALKGLKIGQEIAVSIPPDAIIILDEKRS